MRLGVGVRSSNWRRTRRGKVAVRSAGSVHVAVDAVVLDDHSGFEERFEVQQIEQLVAEPAVERLNPCVLPG